MPKVTIEELMAAGSHFGHLASRWNPKMKPYIFMERNGIHIIDLKKTQSLLEEAAAACSKIASEGKRILFVGTKKQARDVVKEEAIRAGEFFATERWMGGTLTNFTTIRKSVKRYSNIEKMELDGTFEKITKKEILNLKRERAKLHQTLAGVVEMGRLPGAIFVVDVKKEAIAIKEAIRLNIPVIAIVDSNCNPDDIDFVIPANDDSLKSIQLISKVIANAIIEGKEVAKATAVEVAEANETEKK